MAGKKDGSFAGWLQRVRRTGEHSDLTVRIQEQEFKLHMLPLVNESTYFRSVNLANKSRTRSRRDTDTDTSSSASSTNANTNTNNNNGAGGTGGTSGASKESRSTVVLDELPGGAAAFELAADFCYIIRPSYTYTNVGSVRAAAEYLGMTDLVESTKKFLYANVYSSWKSCVTFLREYQRVYPPTDEYIESRALRIISAASTKSFLETKHVSVPVSLSISAAAAAAASTSWNSSPSHNLKDLILSAASLPEVYSTRLMDMLVTSGTNLNIKCRQDRRIREWLDYLVKSECKRIRSRCWIILCLSRMLLRGSPRRKPWLELSSKYWCSLLEHACVLITETDDPGVREDLREVKRELEARIGAGLDEIDTYFNTYGFDPDTLLSLVEHFIAGKKGGGKEEIEEDGDFIQTMQAIVEEVDSCLWGFAERGSISVETFVALEEVIPVEYRCCHDALYAAVERFMEKRRRKISGEETQRLWRYVDCSKLTASVYEKAMGNPSYLCQPHVLECVLKRHEEELDESSSSRGGDEQKNMRIIMQKVIKASLKLLEENSRRSKEIKELQKQYSSLVAGMSSGFKIHPSLDDSPVLHEVVDEEDDDDDDDDDEEEEEDGDEEEKTS